MIPSPALIWFLIGVGFLIAELSSPGFILIFFTGGCWITAIFTGLTDVALSVQIIIFIITSLFFIFTLRKYCLKTFKGNVRNNLDDDYTDAKIGKTAIVTKAISPDVPGEIQAMGSFWRAVADSDIDAGQSVRIESRAPGDGLTFTVKQLTDKQLTDKQL